MIKDSINLYENNKYLNLKCLSCGQDGHLISRCPDLHLVLKQDEVIKEYLLEEMKFKQEFDRGERRKYNARKNLEHVQEAASQIQIGHQAEIQHDFSDEDDLVVAGSYSSVDEVLDRKIYDPKPIDFVADTTHMKYLDLSDALKPPSIATLTQVPANAKRSRQRVGEIEMFVRNNYDPYFHNLNLDRVKNFEVYYPNNNINKLMIEFEKVRLEKIVEMRLGLRAKHISSLLIKGFKMYEKRDSILSPQKPQKSSTSLEKRAGFRKSKRESLLPLRSDSLKSNPGNIVNYNSGTLASNFPKVSKYKNPLAIPNSSSTTASFLSLGSDPLKTDHLQKRNSIFKDLSVIKEDNTEKMGVGNSNLSIDSSPQTRVSSPIKLLQENLHNKNDEHSSIISEFQSFMNEIKRPEGLSPDSSWRKNQTPLFKKKEPSDGGSLSSSNIEQEPPSARRDNEVDYTKQLQKLTDKLGENSYRSKNNLSRPSSRTDGMDKEGSLVDKDRSYETPKNEAGRLFRLLLQDKLKGEDEDRRRAASEENGRDIHKFMNKHKLDKVFKKMSDADDE